MVRGLLGAGLAGAFIVAIAAACSSFSTDDATSGPDGSVEAGPGTDAAPAPSDAASDAASDAGGACATLIAESFDTSALPPGFGAPPGNSGVFDLSDAQVKSPPAAFEAMAALDAGAPTGNVTIQRLVPLGTPLGTDSIDLDFWVYLEAPPTAFAELGCTLELRNRSGDATRLLFARSSDGPLSAIVDPTGGNGPIEPIVSTFVPGWHHVHVVATNDVPTIVSGRFTLDDGPPERKLDAAVASTAEEILVHCGIDFAKLDPGAGPAIVKVWVDDLGLQRCSR